AAPFVCNDSVGCPTGKWLHSAARAVVRVPNCWTDRSIDFAQFRGAIGPTAQPVSLVSFALRQVLQELWPSAFLLVGYSLCVRTIDSTTVWAVSTNARSQLLSRFATRIVWLSRASRMERARQFVTRQSWGSVCSCW